MDKFSPKNLLLFLVGIAVAAILVLKVLIPWMNKPAEEEKKRAEQYKKNKGILESNKRVSEQNNDFLAELSGQAFAFHTDAAITRMGARLTELIKRCELSENDFTRRPHKPTPLMKYGANQIGFSVSGQGSLRQIIDLLFLIKKDPYLSRVEGLSISPTQSDGQVQVSFQYLSLVIGRNRGHMKEPIPNLAATELNNGERQLYAAITKRAFFLPYEKKPPPPPPPPPAETPPPPPPLPPPPGPETYVVNDLSEWNGSREVRVLDTNTNTTAIYRQGDPLAGGKVVEIDYRKTANPKKPELFSYSRVILKIGEEFWTIELGNTLADKHRLEPGQLPESLR